MADTTDPAGPPADLGPMQALGRVARVFTSPRRLWEELRDRPNWAFPLLLSMVVSFLLAAALFSRPEGRESLQKALAAAPGNLGELEKVQLLKAMEVAVWIGAVAGVAVGNLFLAMLLWGTSSLAEGRARFRSVFSFQLHAQMVTVLPQILGLWILIAHRGGELKGSDQTLPFTLARFLPETKSPGFLQALAASIDPFTLWYWALVLAGLPVIAQIPRKKVIVPVLVLLAMGILLRAATLTMVLGGP
jgi:Yip1-like protein